MIALYDRIVGSLGRHFGSGGILAYHGVGPHPLSPEMHVDVETFRSQLMSLREHFEFISLSDFVSRLSADRSIQGCLALTFDDAYVGVCRFAAPVLRELDIPATVFVCSAQARGKSAYWWDLVYDIRSSRDEVRWEALLSLLDLPRVGLGDRGIFNRVKQRVMVAYSGRGTELVDQLTLRNRLGDFRSADYDELCTLASQARVEFGCHTASHPALPLLSVEEQAREITTSLRELETHLPRVRPFIAYPYGAYDEATLRIARECGMKAGFTIEPRIPVRSEYPTEIPRLCMQESFTIGTVFRNLATAHRIPRILFRGRRPRFPGTEGARTAGVL